MKPPRAYQFTVAPTKALSLDEGFTFIVEVPGSRREQAFKRVRRYMPGMKILTGIIHPKYMDEPRVSQHPKGKSSLRPNVGRDPELARQGKERVNQ